MKIILYHDHCQDGFFSAYLAWKYFKEESINFIPINYRPVLDLYPLESLKFILNQKDIKIEDCKEADLYIFDFCFPENFLLTFKDIFKSVLVLDHHQTCFDKLKINYSYTINENGWFHFKVANNVNVYLSNQESSAKLVYKYFYKNSCIPWYIELVSDRDLRKNCFKDADNFYHGITLYDPYEFKMMDYLVETDFKNIIELGQLVKRNKLNFTKEISNNLINIDLKHKDKIYKGAIINTDLNNTNDVGDYVLYCIKEHDFCLLYNIKNNREVHCSIRSLDTFNSLIISEKFKGGGHRTSGGFCINLEVLFDILNNNFLLIE